MTADADEVIVTAFFSNQVSSVTFSLHLTLPYVTFTLPSSLSQFFTFHFLFESFLLLHSFSISESTPLPSSTFSTFLCSLSFIPPSLPLLVGCDM